MPDWLAIGLAIASPLLGASAALATVVFAVGRRFAVIETTQGQHSKALEALPDVLKAFVTKDEGRGYQAQFDRLEANADRLANRLGAHEQATNLQITQSTNALSRLEEAIKSLKDGVDRLSEAERSNSRGGAQMDMLTMLKLAAEVAPLVRQVLSQAGARVQS